MHHLECFPDNEFWISKKYFENIIFTESYRIEENGLFYGPFWLK